MARKETDVKLEYELQKATFKEWINCCLSQSDHKDTKVNNMDTDLSSGVVLIYLMEFLTGKKFPHKYEKQPKLPVHMIANCESLLAFIGQIDNLHLGGKMSATSIVESSNPANMKQIVGLLWALIRRYHIPMGSTGFSMRQQLLLFFQKSLSDYRKDIGEITDFTTCFQSGLAFLALICKFTPSSEMKWDDYKKNNKSTDYKSNLTIAFEKANVLLKIPPLLNVDDILAGKISEACNMTYLAYFCSQAGGIAGSVATAIMERKLRSVMLVTLQEDKEKRQKLLKSLADDATTTSEVCQTLGIDLVQSKSLLLATLDDEIMRRESLEIQLQEGLITAAEVAKKLGFEKELRSAFRDQLKQEGIRRNEIEKLLKEGKMTREDAIAELGLQDQPIESVYKYLEDQRKKQNEIEAQIADESVGAADALQKLARESEAKAAAERELEEEKKKRQEMEQQMKDGQISSAEIAAKLFSESQSKALVQQQLDEERERRMILEIKVESMATQLDESRVKYQREVDERTTLLSQLNSMKEMRASLDAQVASLREQLDYTRQDASSAAEKAAAGSETVAELKTAIAVANEKTIQANQKKLELEEVLREITAKLDEEKASRSVISKQLDEERSARETVSQELARERVSHVENKTKLENLEARIREETQAKNIAVAQLAALKEETASLDTKAAVASTLANQSDSALREAQTKRAGAEQILAERTARIAELEAKLSYEQEARSDISAKYQVERDSHLALSSKNDLLKEQLAEARQEIMKYMTTLNAETEKSKTAYSQLEDLRLKNQLNDRQLAEATSTTSRLTEQVEVMRKEADQMRAQLSATDNANASTDAKVSILKEQLMETQERASKSMLEIVNITNEKTNISNQLDSTQADLRHTRSLLETVTQERNQLSSRKDELEKDCDRLTKERELHIEELTQLRSTKITLTKERDVLLENKSDLESRLERTEKHLAELKSASQMSSGELSQLLQKANNEVDSLTENVRKLELQNKKLTDSVFSLTDFKKLVEDKILAFGPADGCSKEEREKRETQKRAKAHLRERELNRIPAIEATIQKLQKEYKEYEQALKKNPNVTENEIKMFEASILLKQGETELDLHTRLGTVAAAELWEASMKLLESDGSKTKYELGDMANQRINAVSNQLRFAREVIGMMSVSEAKASREIEIKNRQNETLAGLMKGSIMLKYKSNTGKPIDPQKRFVFFAMLQEPTIVWCEYGPFDDLSKSVKFKDFKFATIESVFPKASEAIIQQHSLAYETGKLSFSILTSIPKNVKNAKRDDYIIDLVCPDEETHSLWTNGLNSVLEKFRTGFVGNGVGVPMRVELVLQREMGNAFDYNKTKTQLENNVKRKIEETDKQAENLLKSIVAHRVEVEKNMKLKKQGKETAPTEQLSSKIDDPNSTNTSGRQAASTRQAVRLFVDKSIGLPLDTLVVWALENQSLEEFKASVLVTVNSRSEKPFSSSDFECAWSLNDGNPRPLDNDSILGLIQEHGREGNLKLLLCKNGTLAPSINQVMSITEAPPAEL